MSQILIGIDDTDNRYCPGTGRLARRLTGELERLGAVPLGTTGHQFLIDPHIPYTGHNRGICIAVNWNGPLDDLDFVCDLVRDWSSNGSDPGVCIAAVEAVSPALITWGDRALREILTMGEALALANKNGLILRELGGTGGGVIGALASVGLRAGGENGRFVDLPGLRELGESVTAERLVQMGIVVEYPPGADICAKAPPAPNIEPIIYRIHGWIRPRLVRGRPLLAVEWSDSEKAWVPVEQKNAPAAQKSSNVPTTPPERDLYASCRSACP